MRWKGESGVLTLKELLSDDYDKYPVNSKLKHRCFRCDGKFMTRDVGSFECPCGIVIYESALLKLEYEHRVPFLLKREVLIDEGWKKCPSCSGRGKGDLHVCEGCLGVGAIERFDCNGKCWKCRFQNTPSIEGNCDLCDGFRTKEAFDQACEGVRAP